MNPNTNLVIQIVMGVALLVGMFLARRKKFTAHGFCQASVMVLNLALIFSVMVPSFHRQVQPELSRHLSRSDVLIPFLHAMLGTIVELNGLYIILVAGTNIIPKALRFDRYRPWMRTQLALWWITIFFGIGAFYYLNVHTAPAQPQTMAKSEQSKTEGAKVTIKFKNFEFSPKEVTVKAGTTVEWVNEGGNHPFTAEDGSFGSAALPSGGRYEHKFDTPGTYPYYCKNHGDKGGVDMAGVIKVEP